MTWVEVVWPMMSAASLTLAGIHLMIWILRRNQPVHLMFAIAAASVAGIALLERMELRATTPEVFAAAIRYAHPLLAVFMIAVIGIVRLQFRAGRRWLAWTAGGMRVAALIPNFFTGVNLNFQTVHALQYIELWGSGPLAIGVVEANPWMLLGQLSNLLMVVFLIDAIVQVRRRDDPRQGRAVLLVGGSFALAMLLAGSITGAVSIGLVQLPLTFNPMFLPVILAMSYLLGTDVVRAAQLSEQLQRNEIERLQRERELAHHHAQVTHLSRVATIGELTGSLAHELSQPLAAILSNTQAALGLVAAHREASADMRECLDGILASDKRAIEVIRRLRRMLKNQTVELQDLNLNELVHDTLQLARNDLLNRGVLVLTDLASDLPDVRGDRVQLQQVMLNLLLNAGDAMAGFAPEPRLTLQTRLGGEGRVELLVEDVGPGIPVDQLEAIFEPFMTTKRDGLGLGLAVTRTIVQMHNGSILARNNNGGGASFVVSLQSAGIPARANRT